LLERLTKAHRQIQPAGTAPSHESVSYRSSCLGRTSPCCAPPLQKFEPQLDFVPASALATAFKRSPTHAAATARLAEALDAERGHPAALLRAKYGVAGWDALKALTWREQLLLTRNRNAQTYRHIQMFVLAVMVSTLFLRGRVTNTDSVGVCATCCLVLCVM
jgi:hypothetical protein